MGPETTQGQIGSTYLPPGRAVNIEQVVS